MYFQTASVPSPDAIPFWVALGLSLLLLGSACFRIWDWFMIPNHSWWHMLASGPSAACTIALVGILNSGVYEKYHGAYVGLLLVISGLSGLYEVGSENGTLLSHVNNAPD